MKRIVDLDREYRCSAEKAIEKFCKRYQEETDGWRETFEWMAEAGVEHFIDDTMGDGSKVDWSYSLWLEQDESYTYIALILRA